ncbi:uncharacterized protein LOC114874290 [Osmia bicornis bicornis]|uniref:uncharacterized protein LOC114874290 n=1 Tax=Osmia bicornis bicornis TaxID=1437191 RepID=UPI001EAF1641|nr:uncharacterized protein LOC114874290 [Osmia bicornis bicornis]
MAESKRKITGCYCIHKKLHRPSKQNEQCKKKRQTFVYNPEEDMYHEPYLKDLRKEFSDASILCDSKIELPWKDIALPSAGMKIRQQSSMAPLGRHTEEGDQDAEKEPSKKESESTMPLPWKDLIIMETVPTKQSDPASCDSTLEIPWDDLVLEKPIDIQPLREEACVTDDVEIPWDDILVPRNIIIEAPTRKHPSSKYPPRTSIKKGTRGCCCTTVECKKIPATSK